MTHSIDAQLALSYAPGVGPKTYQKLIQHFGAADEVFKAKTSQWQQLKLAHTTQDYLQNPDWQQVERELRWREQAPHHILTLSDPQYPDLLKQIPDPPPILYVAGDADCLNNLQIAIVGSRNPTPDGQQNAFQFAKFLGQAGLSITSGLALGIDDASHRGALAAHAQTIAVLGTGLDTIYPRQHQALAEQIKQQGALVSEFPLGTASAAANFPRRNRIVSGLSLGCLIVEAALRSGSLITAKHAVDQGREVFAIPGSIHSPLSKGSHQLIREGAKLVETAQDIVVEISVLAHSLLSLPAHTAEPQAKSQVLTQDKHAADARSQARDSLDADYQTLLDAIAYDPVSADTLILRTGMSAREVSSMLLMLELKGYIKTNPGGTYVKASNAP